MQKLAVTVFIVLACVLAVLAARHFFFRYKPLTPDQSTALRTIGKPDMPVWIVEYFDYQCVPCGRASELIDELLKKYPSRIYFQTRFFPLQNHPYAFDAALYAECASEQGKFWEFHKSLFSNQSEWSHSQTYEFKSYFEKYVKGVGLDPKRMESCVQNEHTSGLIRQEIETAKSMGISSTPTFYINGQMVVGIPALEEVLSRLVVPETTPETTT
ncbi:MAG: hypothetical protein A3C47_02225 [Omnitrophica bacterium RIFCSPHIGHO2_02_FULL_51_18]|nr:MAG: hypothetical protein A3C47_02225 [Omnitrophica bacterium RIFCSPHIGHO2_02_FULL_51_18]